MLILTLVYIHALAGPQGDKQVNILCILVDDLGFGDLGIQGAPDLKTPHIDQLARQGMMRRKIAVVPA